MKNRRCTGILLESLFGNCCNCTLRISWAISLCHREISSKRFQGKRTGQHSVRINDQWRICFVWTVNGPEKVTICDYH